MLSTAFKVSTTVRLLERGRARLVSALRRRPLVQQLADLILFIFILFIIVTPILLAYRLVNRDTHSEDCALEGESRIVGLDAPNGCGREGRCLVWTLHLTLAESDV